MADQREYEEPLEREKENSKLKASKEDRLLVERFMEYADGYLSKWITWNDVMPVVEKIESKDVDLNMTVIIKNQICSIIRHYHSPYEEGICFGESYSKIKAVWQAAIIFIKYFNSLTPKSKLP